MKQIILAYASGSSQNPGFIKKLRNDIAGLVSIIEPDRDKSDHDIATWISSKSPTADVVVFFFSAVPPDGIAAPTRDNPLNGEQDQCLPVARTDSALPVLNLSERSEISDDPTTVVCFFEPSDAETCPEDLRHFRQYDISSQDGLDAFLCCLVHPPIKKGNTRSAAEEAAAAAFKLVAGALALLIGLFPRTNEILVPTIGKRYAAIVQICMGLTVFALLFTGLVALIRLALFSLKSLLGITDPSELLTRKRLRWIAPGSAAIIVCIIAYHFFPSPPSIEVIVTARLKDWGAQLVESQQPNGGIREHRDLGVSQVWISSQCLCGLLCSQRNSPFPTKDIKRAFTFIDRTRIEPLELLPDVQKYLTKELSGMSLTSDLGTLPKAVPSFTMELRMLASTTGATDLDPKVADSIEKNKKLYFRSDHSDEGWGYYDQFRWGVTEISAWVVLAEVASLRAAEPRIWTESEQTEIKTQIRRTVDLICQRQIASAGGFSPISNVSEITYARTYSTSMAVWALSEAASDDISIYNSAEKAELKPFITKAIRWLESTVDEDGWKANPKNPADTPLFGLTAQTLCILRRVPSEMQLHTAESKFKIIERRFLQGSSQWQERSVSANESIIDSDRYLYPDERVIEGSVLLWYPWCVGLTRSLSNDNQLSPEERKTAQNLLNHLQTRVVEFSNFVADEKGKEVQWNYVPAEALIGYNWPFVSH